MNKLLKLLAFKLIITLVVLMTCLTIAVHYINYSGPLNQDKTVTIEYGLTQKAIVNILHEQNIISHPKLFAVALFLYSKIKPIKSGEYSFAAGISPAQILKILGRGKSVIRKFVIYEGESVKLVFARLIEAPFLFGVVNSMPTEGTLMPETYFYSYGDKKNRLLATAKSLMKISIDSAWQARANNSILKSKKELLILASIIESEAANEQEKPLISAVYTNRLKLGMRLQADPTVIYGLKKMGIYPKKLLTNDLKIPTKYNTYINSGLPPTPIGCPSLSSLMAAAKPAPIKAIYFVLNSKGNGHNFSKTYKEHQRHVQHYRKFKSK